MVRQARTVQFQAYGKGCGQTGEGSAVLSEWIGAWSDRLRQCSSRRMERGMVRQVGAAQFEANGKGRGQTSDGSAVLGEWKGA